MRLYYLFDFLSAWSDRKYYLYLANGTLEGTPSAMFDGSSSSIW